MQCVLDWFFHARKFVVDCITFASVRLFGIECKFEEVKARAYPPIHTDLNLDGAQDLDTLLALAKDRLKDALDRRAFVTDKTKTLITLNTALLAILAAFLPKATTFDAWWVSGLFYLGVLLLLNSLLVMWMYFDIKGETVMNLEQAEVGLDKDNLKKSLINSYLRCQAGTDGVTDYLADLYKTARFYFLAGFVLLFVIFSANFFTRAPTSDAEKLVEQIRSDPKLIETLRGPKGEPGSPGVVK